MAHQHFHAVIWIDHHEARIFHFNALEVEEQKIHPHGSPMHVHHKGNTIGSGHERLSPAFIKEITGFVAEAGAVLIVGPGTAKTELVKHITEHDHKLKAKICGVETVDHPTDGQIVAYARKFFKASDRATPQV